MTIEITIEERKLRPGAVLRGTVALTPAPGDEGNRVELSVMWETAGKGDTDLGVVLFRVLEGEGTFPFEAPLPLLPVTYEGSLLSIEWMVRVRRLRTLSEDDVAQETFRVDAVPS